MVPTLLFLSCCLALYVAVPDILHLTHTLAHLGLSFEAPIRVEVDGVLCGGPEVRGNLHAFVDCFILLSVGRASNRRISDFHEAVGTNVAVSRRAWRWQSQLLTRFDGHIPIE